MIIDLLESFLHWAGRLLETVLGVAIVCGVAVVLVAWILMRRYSSPKSPKKRGKG